MSLVQYLSCPAVSHSWMAIHRPLTFMVLIWKSTPNGGRKSVSISECSTAEIRFFCRAVTSILNSAVTAQNDEFKAVLIARFHAR